jgi:hypothetical protein
MEGVAKLTLAGVLRDWRHRRDLDNWAKTNVYPGTVQRKYWTSSEYEVDAARLKACGYTVVAEEDANPNIDVAPEPNIYSKDPRGPLPLRIPMFHVTYKRREQA